MEMDSCSHCLYFHLSCSALSGQDLIDTSVGSKFSVRYCRQNDVGNTNPNHFQGVKAAVPGLYVKSYIQYIYYVFIILLIIFLKDLSIFCLM